MRVKIVPRILYPGDVGKGPGLLLFSTVEKLVIEDGQLKIDYKVVEKPEIQRVKLSTDIIHEMVLEFF